jgi:hypothetical protein
MSDNKQTPTTDTPPQPSLITLTDFDAVDFLGPIAEVNQVDCHVLEAIYLRAAKAADEAKREPDFGVYRLLTSLCGLHFKVEDQAGVFGPQWAINDKRSAIPDDWRGEQNRILAELIPRLRHPGLRARVADVVWTCNKKVGEAAHAAIDAYCEAAEGLGSGVYKDRFQSSIQASQEEIDLIQRALQIASQVTKKGKLPDRVIDNITRLYDLARGNIEPVPFSKIARLRLQHELIDPGALAFDAEAVATAASANANRYPLAIKAVWDLAAAAHARAGDNDAKRRCQLSGVDQTLKMREQVDSAAAAAGWTRTAIAELRQIEGTNAKREALRQEMRALQEKAQDEVGSFSVPLDLSAMESGTIRLFESLTLPSLLMQFALLSRPQPVQMLRDQALAIAKEGYISTMFGTVHVDAEGKIIAETEGAPFDGEPSEDWIEDTISKNMEIMRRVVVAGRIEPARQTIMRNYALNERHFLVIVSTSPFIPPEQAMTFALGFARFMQGDYISAAHLLIPLVENSVRHVLWSANFDASKMMPDMLQEDRPLSALLDQLRPQMEKILSPEVVLEIDLLFNHRPGPALRHEFGHGKVASGYCYHPDVIYACWFIYHLSCAPLLRSWNEHIAPAIEAECF